MQSLHRSLIALAVTGVTLVSACSDATTSSKPTAALIAASAGNNQIVALGSQPSALQVRVLAADSTPLANVTVGFSVVSGSATITPSSTVTNATGYASAQLTLTGSGTVSVIAAVLGTSLTTQFTVSAVAATTDCSSPVSFAVGQVASATGAAVCATAGSTAAEYALIPFYGTAVSSALTSFQVSATGVTSPSASPAIATTAMPSLSLSSSNAGLSLSARTEASSFELGLRARERKLMNRYLAGARSWQRNSSTSGALRNAIPATATVGQLMTLNANADSDCTAPIFRTGRVAAITSKAIVVADTGNPSGGYTDAEYASLGASFDTLIDPLDTKYFGQPSDIDKNGKIVLFFTKAVNDLTPASSSSYIGGFFYARDLFPTQATTTLDACASSNVGEMFYMMVPDASRGGAFTKSSVSKVVLATAAHEYQHLINAARRMYVNTAATDFEEVWLNEGLSHIAEELLFYEVAGITPRLNLGLTELRQSQTRVDAFNNFALSNFSRYLDYLGAPGKYGPYSDNDSLETRGATWAFLRYAADRHGTTDADVFYQLVNSTTGGLANLRNVLGTDILNQVRDWQVSVLTDDITGAASAYQQPSWNFRSIYTVLAPGVFPLSTVALSSSPQSVTLVAGSSAYLRFTVPANSTASVQVTGAPAAVQFTLVRTK